MDQLTTRVLVEEVPHILIPEEQVEVLCGYLPQITLTCTTLKSLLKEVQDKDF
jgi:hypothetical protein